MCQKLPVGTLGIAERRMKATTKRQPALRCNHTGSILFGYRPHDEMSVECISDRNFEPFIAAF